MRYYQPNYKYTLDRTLYKRTVSTIQDYQRMVEEVAEILTSSPVIDNNGGGRSSLPSTPTEGLAIRVANLERQIHIIEESIKAIPKEYREGVWYNIMEGRKYPITESRRTYSRYKQIYIYEVAKRFDWIN